MTDEEFKREVDDLVEMLDNLRLIRDKGLRRWLLKEVRSQLSNILRKI